MSKVFVERHALPQCSPFSLPGKTRARFTRMRTLEKPN
nr:MAG TPA: hypothetical protein [Caudoviricetes sp.]